MDLRQLEYIAAIADCGNITKAAEKLYISQSGLNQQLLKIEKELGAALFERDTHKLKITRAGELAVDYAREAIFKDKRFRVMIQDIINEEVGEIRFNIAMEQGVNLFCAIFSEFHKRYPYFSIILEDHTVKTQYERLSQGLLDIGMVMVSSRDHNEVEYIHLSKERFLLGIPKTHRLVSYYTFEEDGDYPEMDLALCSDEPFSLMFSGSTLRQVIDPCFEEAGFVPNVMFESRTNHVVALMVKHGICLTILPESQAKLYQKDIKWFRLPSNPTWESCLIYLKDNPPRKAGRYLINLAVTYSREMQNLES